MRCDSRFFVSLLLVLVLFITACASTQDFASTLNIIPNESNVSIVIVETESDTVTEEEFSEYVATRISQLESASSNKVTITGHLKEIFEEDGSWKAIVHLVHEAYFDGYKEVLERIVTYNEDTTKYYYINHCPDLSTSSDRIFFDAAFYSYHLQLAGCYDSSNCFERLVLEGGWKVYPYSSRGYLDDDDLIVNLDRSILENPGPNNSYGQVIVPYKQLQLSKGNRNNDFERKDYLYGSFVLFRDVFVDGVLLIGEQMAGPIKVEFDPSFVYVQQWCDYY